MGDRAGRGSGDPRPRPSGALARPYRRGEESRIDTNEHPFRMARVGPDSPIETHRSAIDSKPQPRAMTWFSLNAPCASPSPLNGERVGVRGVTAFGVPVARRARPMIRQGRLTRCEVRSSAPPSSFAPPSTPHPGPLLDRGGEGARIRGGAGSRWRPRFPPQANPLCGYGSEGNR
jgi:hypothetical protein